MVEIRVGDQTLELAGELRGFEKDKVACICNLIEIILIDTCILPEITPHRDIYFHFTQRSGGGDYLQEIRTSVY